MRGDTLAVRTLDAGALLLAAAFIVFAGRAVYLEAKAVLAERLIAHAFRSHLKDGGAHLPWSWADVHPIAFLEVPRLGVQRYVLNGASGSSLAFGAGHVDGTGLPNGRGNSVLAGHRDTHFAFLKHLRPGDTVEITTRQGRQTWVVESLGVVQDNRTDLLHASLSPQLTLMTCYPFNSVTRSTQRYVATLRPD